MSSIRLQPAHIALIRREAEAAYPNECCGLLTGTGTPDGGVDVVAVVPSPNLAAAARSDRFEVDPEVRFQTMRDCEAKGIAIVGHYHSHPDHPPEPSDVDLSMAFEPELVWLIAGVDDGAMSALKAYKPTDDATRFKPVYALPGSDNAFDLSQDDPS